MSPATPQPAYCRADAYATFAAQLDKLHDGGYPPLLRAAVAIAMHKLPEADPDAAQRKIDEYAERVRGRVRTDHPEAILAHVHDLLFEQEGFIGNAQDYYNPDNSYIPRVLESKQGIPITLSLIYCCVVDRLGLRAVGIGAPAHFLAAVDTAEARLIVDPFFSGRAMRPEEAIDRISSLTGQDLPHDERLLPEATAKQWLARMIANLLHVFHAGGQIADTRAMMELRRLLGELD